MKTLLRILLATLSLPIAYLVASYAAAPAAVPLSGGWHDAAPATLAALFVVFPFTLIVMLVFGNILISRYL